MVNLPPSADFDLELIYQLYTDQDDAFSAPTLNQHRLGNLPFPYAPTNNVRQLFPFLPASHFSQIFSTNANLILDNDIHDIYHREVWHSKIPEFDIVFDHLQPALRLASLFLTNDRALLCFAQVKFSRLRRKDIGPDILTDCPPITPEMLQWTKEDLVGLRKDLRIAFLGDNRGLDTGPILRLSGYHSDVLVRMMKCPTALRPDTAALKTPRNGWRPCIFLHAQYYHEAIRHTHKLKKFPAMHRSYWFDVARVLTHELCHIWMRKCHPQWTGGREPLAFPTDSLPEAGQCWEQFMFGTKLQRVKKLGFSSAQMYNVDNIEDFNLSIHVPQSYIDQWFLKSFWQNFDY